MLKSQVPQICLYDLQFYLFASFLRLWFRYINARLANLISMSKCWSPNTLFLYSMSYIFNSLTFFYRPWFYNVNTRLAILITLKKCSSPGTLFLVFMTCIFSFSAFFYQPWFLYADIRLAMLISVFECSSSKNFWFCAYNRWYIVFKRWYKPIFSKNLVKITCKIVYLSNIF